MKRDFSNMPDNDLIYHIGEIKYHIIEDKKHLDYLLGELKVYQEALKVRGIDPYNLPQVSLPTQAEMPGPVSDVCPSCGGKLQASCLFDEGGKIDCYICLNRDCGQVVSCQKPAIPPHVFEVVDKCTCIVVNEPGMFMYYVVLHWAGGVDVFRQTIGIADLHHFQYHNWEAFEKDKPNVSKAVKGAERCG